MCSLLSSLTFELVTSIIYEWLNAIGKGENTFTDTFAENNSDGQIMNNNDKLQFT